MSDSVQSVSWPVAIGSLPVATTIEDDDVVLLESPTLGTRQMAATTFKSILPDIISTTIKSNAGIVLQSLALGSGNLLFALNETGTMKWPTSDGSLKVELGALPDQQRIVVYGGLEVRGDITATGSITPSVP